MSCRNLVAHALVVVLAGLSASGCGGGGGGGGGGPADPAAQTAAAIASLDGSALAGSVTGDEFATRLEELLAAVDGRAGGVDDLELYYQEKVVGTGLTAGVAPGARAAPRTAKETVAAIQASETYQMLVAFVESVASNLLVPDPASTLLSLADPDVFLATASVTIRAQIYQALVNGQITPEQAEVLYEQGRKNPWAAMAALRVLLAQPSPSWEKTMAQSCLRDCRPSGDTTVYSGTFLKVFSSSSGGCTWQERLAGTVEVDVTGVGTVADPFQGSMDVTGSLVETLTAGGDCDPGGTYEITSFDGSVSGDDGELYAEGAGVMGAGTFHAAIDGATITASTVTGQLQIEVGDESVQMAVTLRDE